MTASTQNICYSDPQNTHLMWDGNEPVLIWTNAIDDELWTFMYESTGHVFALTGGALGTHLHVDASHFRYLRTGGPERYMEITWRNEGSQLHSVAADFDEWMYCFFYDGNLVAAISIKAFDDLSERAGVW